MSIITAAEAKQRSVDLLRDATILSSEAVKTVLDLLDGRVRDAVRYGHMEALISLDPIARLTDINVEASKRATAYLSHELQRLGYRHDGFTNHSNSLTIRWDR